MKNLIERLETRKLLDGTISFHNDDLHPHEGSGDYQIGGRWSTTASGSAGAVGNPVTLTWGFVADGLSIPGFNGEPTSASNLIARLNTKYGPESVWLPMFQSVFDRWSQVTGVTYVYQATDDGAAFGSASGQLGVRADIRIGGHNIDGGFNILAYNFYPGSNEGGDMVIDTSEFISGGTFVSTANNNRAFRNTLSHEHGHGLGIAHVIPQTSTKLMEPTLATAFDGPQFDDILAGQRNYGDPLEKNGRNETAPTATNLGTLALGNNITLAQQVSIATTTDNDYFKFTVEDGRTVSFTVTPDGTTYNQGPQSGTATSFNAAAQGNLTLTVYDTNGTTVLQSATGNAIGLAESINNISLPAGTYFVKVAISAGTSTPTQMYKLSATVISGFPSPSTPDLAVESDTGSSNSDNITADNTPTFTGTAPNNATITLYSGATVIGTGTASGSGAWSITASTLADGAHTISATATDGSQTSTSLTPLTITVDTVGASIVSATYDRDLTQRVTLVFSDAVTTQITASELTLTNTTTSAVTNPVMLTSSAGNTTLTVMLSSSLLSNGRYVLALPANAATDVAGNGLVAALNLEFVQLAGDANGDGAVTFDDLLIVAQNYGQNQKTFSQGNFNYDASGLVDFSDLLIIAQNYETSVLQSKATVAQTTVTAQSKRKTNNRDILA